MRAQPQTPDAVIPAKAGIQRAFASCTNIKMDPSFRWDDGIDGYAGMPEPLRGCIA